MYTNVNEFAFMEAFKDMGRMDNFSPDALRQLFAFFEELEEGTDEPMELDVIAICCDFSEEPLVDVLENYGLDSVDDLHDNTMVVGFTGNGENVVYQCF